MDRCCERLTDHPCDARGRSSDRSARSRSVHRSTGRPVGSPNKAVAAQSLVEYVRLAALCGLLRCEIAEDPKGNQRRRSMSRHLPRELASGSSEKWRRPVSTGVRIPGSGPAANTDDRSTDRQSQCIMRTILRTKLARTRGAGQTDTGHCHTLCAKAQEEGHSLADLIPGPLPSGIPSHCPDTASASPAAPSGPAISCSILDRYTSGASSAGVTAP